MSDLDEINKLVSDILMADNKGIKLKGLIAEAEKRGEEKYKAVVEEIKKAYSNGYIYGSEANKILKTISKLDKGGK